MDDGLSESRACSHWLIGVASQFRRADQKISKRGISGAWNSVGVDPFHVMWFAIVILHLHFSHPTSELIPSPVERLASHSRGT